MQNRNAVDDAANLAALFAIMGEEMTPEALAKVDADVAAADARFAAEQARDAELARTAPQERIPVQKHRYSNYGREVSRWSRD